MEQEPVVETMYEIGNESAGKIGFWARGHYDLEAFARAIKEQWGYDVKPGECRQEWRRCVPWADDRSQVMLVETRPGRGAFPVTVVELG